jgi:hypothetical protein
VLVCICKNFRGFDCRIIFYCFFIDFHRFLETYCCCFNILPDSKDFSGTLLH